MSWGQRGLDGWPGQRDQIPSQWECVCESVGVCVYVCVCGGRGMVGDRRDGGASESFPHIGVRKDKGGAARVMRLGCPGRSPTVGQGRAGGDHSRTRHLQRRAQGLTPLPQVTLGGG